MNSSRRPNIILITTDQQRYDSLGCNGADRVRTPNIDALAARGTRFSSAYIQNPVCIPSRACIQTGRYTSQHGVSYMESVIDETPGLPPWERTFMDHLADAGYRNAAFGKIHMMPERGFHDMRICGGKGERWTQSAGLPIGPGPLGNHYASWLEERHPGGYELIYRQRRESEYGRYKSAVRNVLPLEEYVDYWIGQNAVDYINSPPADPFFLWCGFCGPHGPVDPPKPYDSLYPFDEIELPPNFFVDGDGCPRTPSKDEEAVMRCWISYYHGLCTLIDDQVGRITEAISGADLWENTVVIYVSDHGEMLGERGRLGKGNFFEPVIRVPLIVVPPAVPGRAPAAGEVDGLVETMDIAPTILEYAGLAVPPEMSASSLTPLIRAEGGGRESVLCEYTTNDQARSGKCLRTERYKYCFWTGAGGDGGRPGTGGGRTADGEGRVEHEFYDLQEDPLERTNLFGSERHRSEIDRHRDLLLRRLTETGRRQVMRAGNRVY